MDKYKLEIKWGLIFTVAALLWMVIEKSLGWHDEKIADHATYTNIFAVVAIAVYVFALLEKRKSLGGKMTWKEGFVSGTIITLVVVVLTPLSQWLTHNVISPDYFQNAIANAVENNLMPEADAEKFFSFGGYLMMAAVGGLIMGLITSAIVSLVLKKE